MSGSITLQLCPPANQTGLSNPFAAENSTTPLTSQLDGHSVSIETGRLYDLSGAFRQIIEKSSGCGVLELACHGYVLEFLKAFCEEVLRQDLSFEEFVEARKLSIALQMPTFQAFCEEGIISITPREMMLGRYLAVERSEDGRFHRELISKHRECTRDANYGFSLSEVAPGRLVCRLLSVTNVAKEVMRNMGSFFEKLEFASVPAIAGFCKLKGLVFPKVKVAVLPTGYNIVPPPSFFKHFPNLEVLSYGIQGCHNLDHSFPSTLKALFFPQQKPPLLLDPHSFDPCPLEEELFIEMMCQRSVSTIVLPEALTDRALGALPHICPESQAIEVDQLPQVTYCGIERLVEESAHLSSVTLGLSASLHWISILAEKRGIERLILEGELVTDSKLTALASCCVNFGAVELRGCPHVTDEGLKALFSHANTGL